MSNISTQNALTLQTMNLGSMSLDVVQIGDEPWFYAPSLARGSLNTEMRTQFFGRSQMTKRVHI